MEKSKNKRSSIRVGIKQLTSIVQSCGDYVVIEGDNKPTQTTIKILDISTGGLCIESKYSLKTGVVFDLGIPKVKNLDTTILRCETTRSIFIEDPLYHVNLGTDRDKSYHEIGLKFKNPNTEYLKQLCELAENNQL